MKEDILLQCQSKVCKRILQIIINNNLNLFIFIRETFFNVTLKNILKRKNYILILK